MKTALVLGGGDTLQTDVSMFRGKFDAVVACNDAGAWWPHDLDAWVTLHPRYMTTGPKWAEKRHEAGYPPAKATYAHESAVKPVSDRTIKTYYGFFKDQYSGSSGMFATKVALVDMGFDRAVLCGIPLTNTPHFFGGEAWKSGENYRKYWLQIPDEFKAKIRSMSGWTRQTFGAPEECLT